MLNSVLYITYDGLLEPLGQSQVLAYQEKLAANFVIHILSFEKSNDWKDIAKRNALADRLIASGIHWHPRRYHKTPSALATAYDIIVGTIFALYLVLRQRIGIIHARSYVPSVMALIVKQLTGAKFIFDMRGFWADERVDGGLWPRDGRMYSVAKWFEKRFLLSADYVVSLTHAAVLEIAKFPYLKGKMPLVSVIPTCADLERFKHTARKSNHEFTLGYVGSAGTWYLFEDVVSCFKVLLTSKPKAQLLVINRGEHEYINTCMLQAGISEQTYQIVSADHAEVPTLMARMDAGVFFIKPVFSKQASAPTKLGEFLGCGIPCLGNDGVGDMTAILEGESVGVAISGFDQVQLLTGIKRLLALVAEPDIASRCRAAAEKHFSLNHGVVMYRTIYFFLSPEK